MTGLQITKGHVFGSWKLQMSWMSQIINIRRWSDNWVSAGSVINNNVGARSFKAKEWLVSQCISPKGFEVHHQNECLQMMSKWSRGLKQIAQLVAEQKGESGVGSFHWLPFLQACYCCYWKTGFASWCWAKSHNQWGIPPPGFSFCLAG